MHPANAPARLRRRMRNGLLIFLAACLIGGGARAEEAGPLERALAAIRMTPRDLSFQKDLADPEVVLPVARRFLLQPLTLPVAATETRERLASVQSLAALAGWAGEEATGRGDPPGRPHCGPAADEPAARPHHTPVSVPPVVQGIYEAARAVQPLLPWPDRAAFEAFALEMIADSFDRAALAPGLFRRDKALELQDDEVAKALLAARVDRAALLTAFVTLARAVDEAMSRLGTNDFTADTPLGPIICTSADRQVFTNEAFLIIATGSDNVFSNSAGGANGLEGRQISIVIATGQGNRYVASAPVAQGAGLFGIGILVDLGTNATFAAKHLAQGAGVFGCGMLVAGNGRQEFAADTFCQGAGMFGAGILWQRGGDTSYRAAERAQGYGGTGGEGLLLDAGGDDAYFAGGKYPCGWLAGQKFSLAQGMGMGLRPFAGGGVGVLCDLAGNDRYVADVYGQGASYWYSVGMLLDAAGEDRYEAHQYCQGAAVHLSSGILWDGGGDDAYTAHAICQGGAHDYSVGMLVDDAGNDRYTADSTAQGGAINNSVALLLDRGGDDVYTGTDAKQSQAAGHDGGKREYGSIAVLLDLGGRDSYSQGWTNNSVWTKPWYGAGLDGEFDVGRSFLPVAPSVSGRMWTTRRLVPTTPVDVRHPVERLVRRAIREAETDEEREDAAAANTELKARAAEVLPYLLTRMDSPNVMLRVKTEELVDQLGAAAVPALSAGIAAARNDEVARVCCYFLARFDEKGRAAIPRVLPLLRREATTPVAFYTLGHLRAREAFAPAVAALRDDRELVRLRAAQALGRIGDRRAVARLRPLLNDPWWDVRYAAEEALGRLNAPVAAR